MTDWPQLTLAEVAKFSSGKPIRPGSEGRFKAFGSNGVIGHAPESRHARGLIVGRVGAYCGSVAVSREPFWASDNTIVVEPVERSDLDYLYYLLVDADLNRHAGGAAQPLVTQSTLKALVFRMPSVAARSRIGSTIRIFDELIENNRRRVEVLEEMVRAIYREWFVHFRYPGHENATMVDSSIGPIPDRWAVTTLGQVLHLCYGKALKKENRRGGRVAVVSSAGVVGWHDEHLTDGPTIVVGRKGNVGSVTWVDGPSWPIDTAYYIETGLPLRYVVEQLRRTEFLNTHAAVPGLSREQAYSRPFLQPPGEVMAQFGELSQLLATQASGIAAQAQRLVSVRDLLLPKLVTGQIELSPLDLDAAVENSVA